MKNLILAGAVATAALFVSLPGASAQGNGNGTYCLQKSDSGSKDCSFETMAQCQDAMKGDMQGTCSINTMATEGQGGSMKSDGDATKGDRLSPSPK